MSSIKASELILNPDGSVYHLNLKPENIADTILFVGDQDRVEKISKHFDHVEFETQKREFKTHTGTLKGKRITVISTGIGPDNIDIVMNELDALVNIDLHSRKPKDQLTSLQIIRQKEIPIDGFLMSSHGIDMSGLIHFYKLEANHHHPEIEADFIRHTKWNPKKAYPYIFSCSEKLAAKFSDACMHTGITATAGGFYGPQGRVLRLPISDEMLNDKLESFSKGQLRITNYEMETAVIYGMARLLGHEALSLNAIIANRPSRTFSEDPYLVVNRLITFALDKIVQN